MPAPIKRAIHIDFHTMPGIYNFNEGFDAKEFAQRLHDAGVEYVNVFCKCNIGFAYYPTKIGIPYPGMKGDMFGDTLRECKKLGIGVTAYFNGGLDHEQALRHRDWLVETKDGNVELTHEGNFFRQMCFYSGYTDYLLSMIQEVLDWYPEIDGVFIDCLGDWTDCYGNECVEKAIEMGLDPKDPKAMHEVRKQSIWDFCTRLKGMIGDRYLRLNGPNDWEYRNLNTHCEIECIPGGWSYDRFPGMVAYMRNIYDKIVYMTGRFQINWGDFGGLRTKASLENDLWDAHASGVGVMVGDHMHPAKNIDPAVYDMVKDLYKDVIAMEPWTEDAKYIPDIGVLITPLGRCINDTYAGAVRLLGELKLSYDFVNEDMDLTKYKLLIIPDVPVTEKLAAKLRVHIDAGKPIISTAKGGLTPKGDKFAMADWDFVEYDGLDTTKTGYLEVSKETRAAIPALCEIADMPHSLHGQGIFAKPGKDCQILADYVKSYFDKVYDGFHFLFYCPPEKRDGHVAVARRGNIIHFSYPAFSSYFNMALQSHKQLMKYAIDQLLPESERSFKQEGLPSTARLSLTEKGEMKIAHVKLTVPELRGRMNIVEEHNVLLPGAKIAVKGEFNKVYTAPDRKVLAFTYQDGFTHVTLPEIVGYLPVVFEKN